MLLKDIDSEDLIDFMLIGYSGLFPGIILGLLSEIFDFYLNLIVFGIIILVWYLLVVLLYFICKKGEEDEI